MRHESTGKSSRFPQRPQPGCSHPSATIVLSTISQAEILFGLENKPEATRLRLAVDKLFSTVQIASWNVAAAQACSKLRVQLAREGKNLSALDILIAAHAVPLGATLVTHDKAFIYAKPFLDVVDWAIDL